MAVTWDNTWDANPGRKPTVGGAWNRVTQMITRAAISCAAVKRDDKANEIYQRNFADPTRTYLTKVQDAIRAMERRVTSGPVTLSLVMNAPGGVPAHIAANWRNVEAFVIVQTGVATPRGQPVVVYIAPSFFTGNVYVPKGDPTQRSGTGTIVHELSHACAGTRDHAYAWEGRYANVLCNRRVQNADTYRLYCQEFDLI